MSRTRKVDNIMSTSFSLIGFGAGQNYDSDGSAALVARLQKLMKPTAGYDENPKQTPNCDNQQLPTQLSFHNLDLDDPNLSDTLYQLWGYHHRTLCGISHGDDEGSDQRPTFDSIKWVDCDGETTMDRVMEPIRLDLVEKVAFCRIPLITQRGNGLEKRQDSTTVKEESRYAANITSDEMVHRLRRNMFLKELRLENCDPVPLEMAEMLGNGLLKRSLDWKGGYLESLYIKSCSFDHGTIPVLADGLKHARHTLRELTIFWSNIQDDQIELLVSSLLQQQQKSCPSLRILDFGGNVCRQLGMAAVSRLLAPQTWDKLNYVASPARDDTSWESPQCRLERLSLREQCIEDEKLPIEPTFINAIRYNRSLLHLDLSVNKLDDVDMERLGRALRDNRTLQFLDVRSNRITNQGVQVFTRYALMPDHTGDSLSSTVSTDNSVGAPTSMRSVTVTCQHFENITSSGLRKLWLQDNPVGEAGAKVIRDALQVNFQLEYVGFSEYFGDDISAEMEYYMALNWGGRRLLSCNKGMKMSGKMATTTSSKVIGNELLWPLVLERANNCAAMDRTADILYCLLRGDMTVLSCHAS